MSESLSPSQAANSRFGFALVATFTLSIFLSAMLLFAVQPMFAKMVLPRLGGSSGVWNTAMLFFQAVLLCGYIYAHLLAKYLPVIAQVIVHLLVTLLGLLFLPLAISNGWIAPDSLSPAIGLLGLFAVSIGVPFFAITANSPLLQSWFARTDHPDAKDPYFLYAASNAGSLLTLLAYPFLIEPNLVVAEQTRIWSIGYGLMIAAIIVTGGITLSKARASVKLTAPLSAPVSAPQATTWARRLWWVWLAFLPSSLMLGVTSFITNNIASVPFLWIAPLSLYLLTFVIVFAKRPWVSSKMLGALLPFIIAIAILFTALGSVITVPAVIVALISYFILALYCHARLAEARPTASELTSFYIFMSLGGVLGGVANALVAPLIFDRIIEYILVMWLISLLLLPGMSWLKKLSLKAKIASVLAVIGLGVGSVLLALGQPITLVLVVVMLAAVPAVVELKVVPGVLLVTMMAGLVPAFHGAGGETIFRDRSFYSVLRVDNLDTDDGPVHQLLHGDTTHNFQLRLPEQQRIPLAYYAEGNTFHQVLTARQAEGGALNVSIIGLGAGAMACYKRAEDSFRFFEIDPKVVDMAFDADVFSYMSNCSDRGSVLIGDARLRYAELPPASQDVLFVDAFSSDAIPTHLVTQEAFALYVSRMAPGGLIFFHTSNRAMDISSVVLRLSDAAGLGARRIWVPSGLETHPFPDLFTGSEGVVVGDPALIARLAETHPDWDEVSPSPLVDVWTDDYSSVIGAMRAHMGKNLE